MLVILIWNPFIEKDVMRWVVIKSSFIDRFVDIVVVVVVVFDVNVVK